MTSPQPGDAILYPALPTSGWSARLVGAGELVAGFGSSATQYSHAAVMANTPGYQFEAKFPLTGRFKIDTSRVYEIWRLGKPTPSQRSLVLEWCAAHTGKLYDILGVLTGGRILLPGTYYCSRFACLAYAWAGLHPGDSIMSPNSIPMYPGARMIQRFEPKGK